MRAQNQLAKIRLKDSIDGLCESNSILQQSGRNDFWIFDESGEDGDGLCGRGYVGRKKDWKVSLACGKGIR